MSQLIVLTFEDTHQAGETLEPGTSALFVIGSGNPEAVRATLEHFQGQVYQTTLDGEKLDTLKKALNDKT